MHVKTKQTQEICGGEKIKRQQYKAFHLNSFIEAPQLQNGVKFTKTAERYSFTIASVQRKVDNAGGNRRESILIITTIIIIISRETARMSIYVHDIPEQLQRTHPHSLNTHTLTLRRLSLT